jgi:hypothetical protein
VSQRSGRLYLRCICCQRPHTWKLKYPDKLLIFGGSPEAGRSERFDRSGEIKTSVCKVVSKTPVLTMNDAVKFAAVQSRILEFCRLRGNSDAGISGKRCGPARPSPAYLLPCGVWINRHRLEGRQRGNGVRRRDRFSSKTRRRLAHLLSARRRPGRESIGSGTSNQAARHGIPICRPGSEIEPCLSINSISLILPGPTARPASKPMRSVGLPRHSGHRRGELHCRPSLTLKPWRGVISTSRPGNRSFWRGQLGDGQEGACA